jgi:hypothetical protein
VCPICAAIHFGSRPIIAANVAQVRRSEWGVIAGRSARPRAVRLAFARLTERARIRSRNRSGSRRTSSEEHLAWSLQSRDWRRAGRSGQRDATSSSGPLSGRTTSRHPAGRSAAFSFAGGADLVGERAALSQVVQPAVCRPLRRERGAARPHHMRPRLADSAGRRSAANREHWCAALGAVALPAGTTVGQGHLLRVGDGDLFAADASALWVGLRCLWVPCARFNHGQAAYSRPIGFPAGAANQPPQTCGRRAAGEACRCIGSVARDCPL